MTSVDRTANKFTNNIFPLSSMETTQNRPKYNMHEKNKAKLIEWEGILE